MDARPELRKVLPRQPRVISLTVALAIVLATLVLPAENAFAVSKSQVLVNGQSVSVRSADGCTVKPAPPGNGQAFVRNFICVFVGKAVRPAYPAASRVQMLANGDKLSVVSGDGCRLKPALRRRAASTCATSRARSGIGDLPRPTAAASPPGPGSRRRA